MSDIRSFLGTGYRTDTPTPSQNRDKIHVLSVGTIDHGSIVHDALLGRPNFRLSITADYRELCSIPAQEVIDVAILHNSLSSASLDDATRLIRERWPLARILVLRQDQSFLEQTVFDSYMEPNIDPIILLAIIEQLHREKRDRRFGNAQR